MAISIGDLVGRLTLDDQFSKGLESAGSKLKDFGSAFLPVSAAFAGAGLASIKFASDLNANMANIATLIPNSTARVEELKTAVQEVALVTGKSTTDISQGLYQVVSAYGDSAESAKLLEINAKAGAAGLATTLDAINLTSAVTKGYGDVSAAASQKAADLAFVTVKLGQTTFPELAGSMGTVIPIAASLGVKQEELFAGFATLTGVTGNAAEVTTQLKGAMTDMIAPNDAMSAAMEKAGITSLQTSIAQDGLVGTIQKLVKSTDGSTESIQHMFNNIRGLPAVLALSGGQAKVFAEKLEAMGHAAGATDQAFKDQTQGINAAGFQFEQLKVRLAVVAEHFGDKLIPVVSRFANEFIIPMVGKLEELVKWFGSLPQPVQDVAIAIGGVLAVAAPLVYVVGSLITAISTVAGLASSAALPWVALAAMVAAFGLAIYKATNFILDHVPHLREFSDWVVKTTGSLLGINQGFDSYLKTLEKGIKPEDNWTDAQKKSRKEFLAHQKAIADSTPLFDQLVNNYKGAAVATEEAGKTIAALKPITDADIVAKVRQGQASDNLKKATELMGRTITSASEAAHILAVAHANSPEAIEKHRKAVEALAQGLAKAEEHMKELGREQGFVTPGITEMTTETVALTNATVPLDVAIRQQAYETLNAAKAHKSHNRAVVDTIMAMEGLTAQQKEYAIATLLGTDTTEKMSKSLEYLGRGAAALGMLGDAIGGNLGAAISKGAGALGDYAEGMANAGSDAEKFKLKVGLATTAATTLGDYLQGKGTPAAAKFGGALSGAATGAKMGTAIMPGYGTAIGAVVGAIAGFVLGGQKLTKQINDMRDAFFASQGGFEAFNVKMAAISKEDWSKRIFDAKSVGDFNAAVKEAQDLLDAQKQATEALDAAVEKYGFTTEQLGPKMAAQKLDEQAKQLLQDWTLLNGAGVDHAAIVEKMGPDFSKYVDTAIAAGVAIPKSMKATIDELYKAGKLVHENGEAFTEAEYNGLSFTETISEQFSTLIEKLDKWLSLLAGIPPEVNTRINTDYTTTGDPGGRDRGHDNGDYDHTAAGGLDVMIRKPTESILAHQGERVVVGQPSEFQGGGDNGDVISAIGALGALFKRTFDPHLLALAMRDGAARAL